MAADRLTQSDYERLAAFRHMLRRFASFSAAAAQEAGLSSSQHQALLAIKGHGAGPITIGALAEQLIVAPHSAAELVGRLETNGLVEKVADPSDRRRVDLLLTPRAEDTLERLSLAHLREVRLLAPRLMALLDDLDALMTRPAPRGASRPSTPSNGEEPATARPANAASTRPRDARRTG